jgi:hypothetical protein
MSKEENESFPPFLFSDIVGVSLFDKRYRENITTSFYR